MSDVPSLAELVEAIDAADRVAYIAQQEADRTGRAYMRAKARRDAAMDAQAEAREQYRQHRTQAGIGAEQ